MFAAMRTKRFPFALILAALSVPSALLAQKPAPKSSAPPANPGELTVDRIYSSPSLSGRLSQAVQFAPGNKVSFLETKGDGNAAQTALYLLDPATGKRTELISAEKFHAAMPAPESKETQATQATGLGRRAPSQYSWAPSGDALLLENDNSLAWYDLKSQSSRVLVTGKAEIADARLSPDGKWISFVRDHNLWLVSVADGQERAITTGGVEELRKGELDWVYPEELDISTAYWWAPDSSAIAFLEMDERPVTQFPIVDFDSYTGEADLQRYPVAGGKNPIVHVYVQSLAGGAPRLMDTGENTDIYLARVNWLPDSRRVAIQRLNRAQTDLDLLLADAATGKSSTLLSEKDLYWINISDDLRFFKNSDRFLWSSERSGYRHLYLYDLSGKQLAQLTSGEWEVTSVDAIDEARKLVYFSSTEKSPLERHLYKVGLDGHGLTRISKQDGVHHPLFSDDARLYVDTYSKSGTPPRQDLYHADGSSAAVINANPSSQLAEFHLSPVEYFAIRSHDGISLNCSIIKPPNFDPSKKYPVIVYTYGGPHAQVVENSWGGSTFLWHQMMAQKGFLIFSLDNRGSAGRGHLFEEPIHYRFGAQELSDQRDGAAWLQHQPYVDPQRIGIWGWSYGGHMTLHAMFEAAEVFKVGFAGGPVTDWHFYDSIYTERYIGLLPQREDSYRESSPIENVSHLKGKLLIAHGTADDNVHFSNTLALINDLIKAGKYVEVAPFPGRGHGVSDQAARRVLMNHVTQFFIANL